MKTCKECYKKTTHLILGFCRKCYVSYYRINSRNFKSHYHLNLMKKYSNLISKKEFEREYLLKEKKIKEIAKEKSLNRTSLGILRKFYGLPKGRLFRYRIKSTFFQEWNSENCYLLGWIFTDGHIVKTNGRITVRFILKDSKILEKMKSILQTDYSIRHYKRRFTKKIDHFFAFSDYLMTNRLNSLSLSLNKSNYTFPKIPERFYRDFIRGCWDGDGSVFLKKVVQKNGEIKQLESSFIGISKEFVQVLLDKLKEQAGIKKKQIFIEKKKDRKKLFYRIRFSTRDSIRLFYYLYGDIEDNLYLERKYLKFIEGIKYFKEREKVRWSNDELSILYNNIKKRKSIGSTLRKFNQRFPNKRTEKVIRGEYYFIKKDPERYLQIFEENDLLKRFENG